MRFSEYLKKVTGDFKIAIKVEWLNYDETTRYEFTNDLYDVNVNLRVAYQKGARRTCTLVLNNDRNRFPINYNSIWFGQKFKLWMGIYFSDETPYYLPQGVFFVNNPNEVYNPSTRTITINGVDKWAWLDGTLNGVLTATYKTPVGADLYQATKELLSSGINGLYQENNTLITASNVQRWFNIQNGQYYFEGSGTSFSANIVRDVGSIYTTFIPKFDMFIDLTYKWSKNDGHDIYVYINGETYDSQTRDGYGYRSGNGTIGASFKKGDEITFSFYSADKSVYDDYFIVSDIKISIDGADNNIIVDPIPPLLSPEIKNRTDDTGNSVTVCPYTVVTERGKSTADILLEYADIMCANIYYDVHGRLILEPLISSADDITDTNKEISWHYTVDEKTFLGITQTYNFTKVYNDFIVLGNVLNGYQFKGRVQNRNPLSNTSIQRIGLKSKPPIEGNQYTSDSQCIEFAKYHAKMDTIMEKSGDISSTLLFHLDVNHLVSVSTPNNDMSKELFLVSGFEISTGNATMNVNVTSVNVLNDFEVVEAEVNE